MGVPVSVGVTVPESVGVAVSLCVGLAVSLEGAAPVGDESGVLWPACPHTAPAITPTTAVITRATTMMAAVGIEPRSLRMGPG